MKLNIVFLDWLRNRKISEKVIEEFGIHGTEHIIIPIYAPDGTFIYNKYRRSPLSDEGIKYWYDKGGKLALYGAHKIKDATHILFTEGEMDALVAWSHNIPAVSGTGGAMSVAPEWVELLSGKEITICFDTDHAGGEGMVKALEMLPGARVLFLPDKPGVKDISEYCTHGGNLNELIKTARTFSGIDEVIADRAERVSKWQSTYFHDAYIKHHTKPAKKERAPRDAKMGDKVTRAKAYPIDELVQFNSTGKARCPFHNEATASLHYYREQNKTWCFGGCGRGYDSIDIYIKLNNCSFKEAVEKLQ